MSAEPGEVLKAACDAVVAAPELRPEYSKDGKLLTTFCNIGARRVAQAMGCPDFDDVNLHADDMVALMLKGGAWAKVGGQAAALHALDGGLAFAARTSAELNEQHGHIAAIRPEARQMSGTLGLEVPMVANVGKGDPDAPLVPALRAGIKTKRNWNCKASQAFPVAKGEPAYYVYRRPA